MSLSYDHRKTRRRGSDAGRARNGGRALLLLASRDPQSAEQIAATSRLSSAETVRQIWRLTDQGFIVAESSADAEVSVYRLNPKGTRTERLTRTSASSSLTTRTHCAT